MGWTSASGYVDRWKEFSKAMRKADSSIHLYACGAPAMWDKDWNDTLIAGARTNLASITDHPLIGGNVTPRTEPLDVFRDFMAVPRVLEQKWIGLRDEMIQGGVKDPHLAVTELQLFARLRAGNTNEPVHLTRDNLVNPGTLAEALYDVLIYHAAIRLQPFVEMVTHSATVNHGGGLRKDHERVWANPCYYAQAAFAEFAAARPVAVNIQTAKIEAPMVLPELKNAVSSASFPLVDALAAITSNGDLLVSVVHCGNKPLAVTLVLDQFRGSKAEVRTLCSDVPWAANTLEHPNFVVPTDTTEAVRNGRFELKVKPYSVVRIRIQQ
jgi:alpha-N-arabinofuranosidase